MSGNSDVLLGNSIEEELDFEEYCCLMENFLESKFDFIEISKFKEVECSFKIYKKFSKILNQNSQLNSIQVSNQNSNNKQTEELNVSLKIKIILAYTKILNFKNIIDVTMKNSCKSEKTNVADLIKCPNENTIISFSNVIFENNINETCYQIIKLSNYPWRLKDIGCLFELFTNLTFEEIYTYCSCKEDKNNIHYVYLRILIKFTYLIQFFYQIFYYSITLKLVQVHDQNELYDKLNFEYSDLNITDKSFNPEVKIEDLLTLLNEIINNIYESINLYSLNQEYYDEQCKSSLNEILVYYLNLKEKIINEKSECISFKKYCLEIFKILIEKESS